MQSPKTFSAICALFLCYATVAHSQDEGETPLHVYGKTALVVQNGRSWHQMDGQGRILFLTGVQDGAALLSKQLSTGIDASKLEGALDALTVTGFHFSEIMKQVDIFYSDSANIKIPIVEAYMYSLEKLKGATSGTLEQLVIHLRRQYNQQ